jgi:hypothetical protein
MAEKKVIELDVDTNLGSLKSQLKQAQAEVQTLSEKFGATSREAVAAAKSAAILKDKIGDAKALTDAFNPDAKFKALSGSLTGVAGGFSVVTGAMGAFGVESEAVEKTLLKVQSAMAIASGAQALGESIDSFKQLGAVVKTAFSTMTTASKAFLVGGIGLLITAVSLLVTNIDAIKSSFNSGLSTAKKYAETTEKQAEAARHAVENFDEYARTLKRVGYEEDTINKKRSATFAKAIKDTESQLKAQKNLIKESKKGLETAQAFDSFGLNATGRLLYGDEEDVKANRVKFNELSGQLEKLKNDKYFFEEQIKKDKETAKKDNDDAAKDRAKDAAEKRKEALAEIAQNQRDATDLFKSEYDLQVRAIQEKYSAEIALAKKYNKDIVDLEKAKKKELQDLEDKQAKDLFDKIIEPLVLLDAKKTKVVVGGEKERADGIKKELVGVAGVRKRLSDAEQAIEDKKRANLTLALEATANTLGQIADLFGKQTKAGKVAAIAEATIQTFLSAQKAYAATVGIPVVGPVLAPINAGLAIAAGIKNIKAITSVKVPNDTGGAPPPSTDTGGGTSIVSPNFNVVGNSGINQLAQLQQTPTKAYVVSGDMTTAQSLDRNRIENATLVQ